MPTSNRNWTYLKDKPVISRESYSLSHFDEILSVELSGYVYMLLVKRWVVSPKSTPANTLTAAQSRNTYEKLAKLTISEYFCCGQLEMSHRLI
jgi:hypothetical protein